MEIIYVTFCSVQWWFHFKQRDCLLPPVYLLTQQPWWDPQWANVSVNCLCWVASAWKKVAEPATLGVVFRYVDVINTLAMSPVRNKKVNTFLLSDRDRGFILWPFTTYLPLGFFPTEIFRLAVVELCTVLKYSEQKHLLGGRECQPDNSSLYCKHFFYSYFIYF